MSEINKFWGMAHYLELNETAHSFLNVDERKELKEAMNIAAKSNMLVGIPTHIYKFVEQLLAAVQERIVKARAGKRYA